MIFPHSKGSQPSLEPVSPWSAGVVSGEPSDLIALWCVGMMARMLVVAASLAGFLIVDAAPVLGRAAPSPPGGRNTDGGPGMGENYTCALQYSGQFGHSPCVAFHLRSGRAHHRLA